MEHTSRIVTVDIHGQRYPIKSSLDAAYVAELAAYVDEKMRLALQECPSGDTLKVAVLAALNIADEYFRAGDEVAGSPGRVRAPRARDRADARPGAGSRATAAAPRAERRSPLAVDRGTACGTMADRKSQVPCFACDGSEARLSRCSNPSESRRCVVCMPLREEA